MIEGDRVVYRPVLRWKRAEEWALSTLPNDARSVISPIIEIPPTREWRTAVATHDARGIENVILAISQAVKGRFLLDLSLMAPHSSVDSHSAWPTVFAVAQHHRIPLVPVVYTRPSTFHLESIRRFLSGQGGTLCLRLKPIDIISRPFLKDIHTLLDVLGVSPDVIDLVVDLEVMDHSQPHLSALMGAFPTLEAWQTVTLLRGAFPASLSEFARGTSSHKREDFLAWRAVFSKDTELPVMFGDYTIQSGIYRQISGPIHHMAANIRYAADEKWLICKGEDVFDESGPGFRQWPALAKLLVERKEFAGASFSPGDDFIAEHAKAFEPTGDATGWVGAGISHHLVLAARQIANVAPARKVPSEKATI